MFYIESEVIFMMPNPNAPDEYKYETDYRKIPSEYLNPRIPKGRGKIKWAPFATLPEQFETIQQFIIDQNKIGRPTLSDDQLNELNFQLHQALHTEQYVHIEYYQSGWLETMMVQVKRIDMTHMILKGRNINDNSSIQLSLLDITKITQDNIQ
ncbi:YolD-like family protein [Staphylococcus succinus]|nr:YolD-like family protein [Staphylococcus succinus]